jgi:hypothetical protein
MNPQVRNRGKEDPPWFAELKVIREDRGHVSNTVAEEFATRRRSAKQEQGQDQKYELIERQPVSKSMRA